MVRVGVIGLGRMGMLHLVNCLKMDDVEVVAAADASKKALNRAKNLGVEKIYADYHDMMSHPSELDAVVISLPNFLHFESVKLALENGLNVFLEKPMANTVEECRDIVRLVEKSGRRFMVGHVMRRLDAVERLKAGLDSGRLGGLEVATIEEIINGPFAHPRVPAPVSDWWFDPKKSGGGALLDVGYHMIDLFRFFAGDCNVVFCSLGHKFNLPVEDGAIVVLRSRSSGAKGIVNVGWFEQTMFPRFNFRVILHGDAGFLNSEEFIPKNLYNYAAKEGLKNLFRRLAGKDIRPLSYTYHYEPFWLELKQFFSCVRDGTEPPVSAVDGLRVIELIETAYAMCGKSPE